MADLSKLYNNLFKYYKEATNKSQKVCVSEVPQLWSTLKSSPDFPENASREVQKWKDKTREKTRKYDRFWKMAPKTVSASCTISSVPTTPPELQPNESPAIGADGNDTPSISLDSEDVAPQLTRAYPRPMEDKLKTEIAQIREDIVYITSKRASGLATDAQIDQLKQKRKELKDKEGYLKNLIDTRERQRRKREKDRKVLEGNPELASLLRKRPKPGRPSIELDQPELLRTIVEIASYGAAADERRRSESLRAIKTLDELTKELTDRGFEISRSAVYLRLLPKRANNSEGKRHVTTVPVRLTRATNDEHKAHSDSEFCKATIRYLEEIASIMGPDQVLFISQDDKARVPIGITAANKQAPLLMHVEYRVKLPDHDWVVADRHKLIPSVYGMMEIKANRPGDYRAVSYSGPTFIAIRSGKHCSSTAASHARDLNIILNDESFFDFTRNPMGAVKPILIVIVDGGPDENPRYEKVIGAAVDHFLTHDLDAIFIATNAPGRSAYNRVERRMAPLSRELSGLILQHDYFGTHLDEQGRTVDSELEKKNFEHAGKVLAEIWSSVVIDTYSTKAAYVSPEESERISVVNTGPAWKSRHIRESHYFLQIVKCDDQTCCKPKRSNYRQIFSRFVPAPLTMDRSKLTANENIDQNNMFTSLLLRFRLKDEIFRAKNGEVPYDLCCPSVKELINVRSCFVCGQYFASVKSVKEHKKLCKSNSALNLTNFGAPLLASRHSNRPVRVAARRQKEKMVIWSSRLNDKHVDWFEDEDLELVEIEESVKNSEVSNLVEIKTHMEVPWENSD